MAQFNQAYLAAGLLPREARSYFPTWCHHRKMMTFRLDPFCKPLHNAALKFPEDAFLPKLPLCLPLSRCLSPLSSQRHTNATREPSDGDRRDEIVASDELANRSDGRR